MKKKEKDSLRSLDAKELAQKVKDAQAAILKLHLEKNSTSVKNSRQARRQRQLIAVIKTYMREKELVHE
jgi:ribosomal protein L29